MPTTVTGTGIAHTASDHVAVGPPAMSLIPPPSPATPTGVPSPFVYLAKSKSGQRASTKMEVAGGRVLTKNSYMDIEKPGNIPAGSLPIKDIVSHAHVAKGKFMTAKGTARLNTEDKPVIATGDMVKLNVLTAEMELAQSVGPLLDGAGYTAALADASKAQVQIITAAEPVSVASGTVVDTAKDLRLPGVLALEIRRSYSSAQCRRNGLLGRGGWILNLEHAIVTRGDVVVLHQEGAELEMARPERGASTFFRKKQLELRALGDGGFEVRHIMTGIVQEYAPVDPGGPALLRRVRDAFDNRLEFELREGVPVRVVDTAARVLHLRYDAQKRLVGIDVEARGQVRATVAYAYDDDGNLASATDPEGFAESYLYDGLHRLVTKRRRNGVRFHYRYDKATGHCTRAWGDGGIHHYEFVYDEAKRTTIGHGNPMPRRWVANEQGSVILATTFDGAVAQAQVFDNDQYVLESRDAAGRTDTFAYDARGNVVERADPSGRVLKYQYEDDRVAQITYPDGAVATFDWDDRGALTALTNELGQRTSLSWDGYGRLIGVYGPQGTIRTWEWDAEHNVVSSTDAGGRTVEYAYDALGNMVTRREGDSLLTSGYDRRGLLTALRLSTGEGVQMEHDGLGNVTRVVDHLGRTTTMKYQGVGRLTELVSPNGARWEFEYDVNELLRKVRNPKREVYELRYDRAGRVVEELTFDGRVIRRSYDKTNHVSRIEWPDGSASSFTYDETGNLLEEANPHFVRQFEYDDNGWPKKASLLEGPDAFVIEYERDRTGRLLSETQNGRRLRYEYDTFGRRIVRAIEQLGEVTRYTYDERNEVATIEHGGARVAFRRDRLGLEVARVLPSGVTVESTYDPIHRLVGQRVSRSDRSEAVILSQRRYEYGVDGLPSRVDDLRWGTTSYVHDELYRLVETRREGSVERTEYDVAGSPIPLMPGDDPNAFVVRMGDVLLRAAGATFEVDARRRRTKKVPVIEGQPMESGAVHYLWDARDRLRVVELADGTTISLSYDAYGRRVRKRVTARPAKDPLSGPARVREVHYLWDGDAMIAEIDTERGRRVFVHEPGTLVPVLQRDGDESFFYVNDRLGTPRDLVDEQGRLAWSGTHTAWGKPLRAHVDPQGLFSRPRDAEPAFRMLGQYWDDDLELGCARFRDYDPSTARWLVPDPLGLYGGLDQFAFATNPTAGTDALGLAASSADGTCNGHGYIQFHTEDGTPNSRPTGVTAAITPAMISTGSDAAGRIRPDGFNALQAATGNAARGHLLGNQLGGPGDTPLNLVTLHQNPTNTPLMRDLESGVRTTVEGGAVVNYGVTVTYPGPGTAPSSVTMTATTGNPPTSVLPATPPAGTSSGSGGSIIIPNP